MSQRQPKKKASTQKKTQRARRPVSLAGVLAKLTKSAPRAKAPQKRKSMNKSQRIPRSVGTSVSDGLNTGMVFRNSNPTRDFFAPRFEKITDITSTGTSFQQLL